MGCQPAIPLSVKDEPWLPSCDNGAAMLSS